MHGRSRVENVGTRSPKRPGSHLRLLQRKMPSAAVFAKCCSMLKAKFLATVFLVASASIGWGAFTTVVIDAGHGGHDAGGIESNIIPEKGVALDVALRVAATLRNAGLRVVMTRSSDVFIPLPTRVAIANNQKNAIFVSIHFNSGLRVGACGIESFYSSKKGAVLAGFIQRCAITTTRGENRGVKPATFYVLRKNKLVSVLVECGFLTNPQDTALARSREYRQRLAVQIARGILLYRKSL
jgi:N-acetylmuramoyl-L-alanine amidase